MPGGKLSLPVGAQPAVLWGLPGSLAGVLRDCCHQWPMQGDESACRGGRPFLRLAALSFHSRLMDSPASAFLGALQVRSAGCIWLLALVSYTGKHPQLLPKLPEIQEAFSHLLGDATELTQEMASRGMSIVYSRGDDAMRSELLASLTGTLQGGGPCCAMPCYGMLHVLLCSFLASPI